MGYILMANCTQIVHKSFFIIKIENRTPKS